MRLSLFDCRAFFNQILARDKALAEMIRLEGCPECNGPLHYANYKRKPFEFSNEEFVRFSLCCGHCRRRVKPPSVLFFGRKRFTSLTILMLAAKSPELPTEVIKEFKTRFNIHQRTISHWRKWFRKKFEASVFWKTLKGLFTGFRNGDDIPSFLIKIFKIPIEDGVFKLMSFLSGFDTKFPNIYRAISGEVMLTQ